MSTWKDGLRAALVTIALVAGFASAPRIAAAEQPFFDELRFGVQKGVANKEDGLFYEVTMFFDPFDSAMASGWKEKLLRPRVFVGGTVASHSDEASMVFAGLAWDANITDKLFVEAGFGGMVHNGNLDDRSEPGPYLGCRALFREYAAIGYDITQNWRVLGQIEHSSHANLCGHPNNGLTRAGIAVGYKF